jgi:hypothetical protein
VAASRQPCSHQGLLPLLPRHGLLLLLLLLLPKS